MYTYFLDVCLRFSVLLAYMVTTYFGFVMTCFSLFIAALAITRTIFGRGTGPVYLNSVRCTGIESSLLSCSHSVIGVACSHSSDAGVVCPSGKLVKVQVPNSKQDHDCNCLCTYHASEEF